MAALVERVGAGGVEVSVSLTDAPQSLDPDLEVVIYRVVQEALTNVMKHAPEATAHVRVSFDARSARVEVGDSGSPCAKPRQQFLQSGRGLTGMRERVAARG